MSIHYIIGRAGSGKSTIILDEIRDILRVSPDGPPLVLLVPEQATFQAEYALVSSPGIKGIIRAQVLSFQRLAWRVMQETGGAARIHIDDTGKKMLLHNLLMQQMDHLITFRASVGRMGFVDKLHELFSEFRRYGITSTDLDRLSANQKLEDCSLIYRLYERELAHKYIDSEDLLSFLCQGIGSSGYSLNTQFWIDGFHGFTPQEMSVVGKIMEVCPRVTISLTVDRIYEAEEKPHELDLFHPTATTMITLRQLAKEKNIVEEPITPLNVSRKLDDRGRFHPSGMLWHIEQHYAKRTKGFSYTQLSNQWSNSLANQVSIYAAVNRRAETEGAAREIIRLVRDEGVRYRDIMIMVRNMSSYEELLANSLQDLGIPFFMDVKRSVLNHPLVEFIRSALEAVTYHWTYDAMFRCIKTELLYPIEEDQEECRQSFDLLENYVLAYGIEGYRWTDGKPWDHKRRLSLEDELAPDISEQEMLLSQRIERARNWAATPLHHFAKNFSQSVTYRDKVESLYGLLLNISASQRLEIWSQEALASGNPEKAREHSQIWSRLMDLLDQMVEMLGHEQGSNEQFAAMIESGVQSIQLGLVPPSIDSVLAGSMEHMRSSGKRWCFLLGANDGVLPSRLKEDGLLTEEQRDRMAESGLHLANGSRRKLLDEQFLIYTSLCSASDHLWVSYSLADEEGKSLLPSEIVDRLKALLPSISVQTLDAEPTGTEGTSKQLSYIAGHSNTLTRMAVQLRQWHRGGGINPVWWDAYNWFCGQPQWRGRLRIAVNGLFYSNQELPLSLETTKSLYGQHFSSSVSRMERFAACPFSQFAAYGLKLKERNVYRLEAPDIGQLFHAALSQLARQLLEEGLSWGEVEEEELRRRASSVIDVLSPRLQSEILLRSKRHGYIANKLKEIVGKAAVVLGLHARSGQFTPIGLEVEFGPDQKLPSISFALANGMSMQLIGRIDRVDQAESDRGMLLRIVDYKSSQTTLRLQEVYYGLALQVLTYLDVAVTNAAAWIGREAEPAGVLYFHVHNPMLQKSNKLEPHQMEDEWLKRFKMRGLLLADLDSAGKMDRQLLEKAGHSKMIPVGVKTDGSFYRSSSVADPEQWNELRSYIRSIIHKIGNGIAHGKVDIEPYRLNGKSPCLFCSFQAVCRFEPGVGGNQYKQLFGISQDDIWTRIQHEVMHGEEE